MRFGVCTKLENLPLLQAEGYDYYEGTLNAIAAMSEEAFEETRQMLVRTGVPMEATAGFFGKEYQLIGESVDFDAIAQYADTALKRSAALGAKIAVLGSGRCRNIPDGFPRDRAEEQFVRVMQICGDAAQKYDIKVALEPLNHTETNLVNTLAEGLDFCKRANHPAVGMLADFYHIFMVNDDLATLQEIGDQLFHVHIARPNADRAAPSMADEATLRQWADALERAGYHGRMSLECSSKPSAEENFANMRSVKELFR